MIIAALVLLFGFISAYCVGFFLLAAKAQEDVLSKLHKDTSSLSA